MFRPFGNLFSPKRVYLDYAGATPVLKEAIDATRWAMSLFGNSGAIHRDGILAKEALEDSRAKIASIFGCKAREIIFTSGATEANNLAIFGRFNYLTLHGKRPEDTHWVVSSIEHPSVLSCFDRIAQMGGDVSYVEPGDKGQIDTEAILSVLTEKTVLVSVGWSNSELGVLQPIQKISRVIREFEATRGIEILLHSDAGQSPLYEKSQIHELGVDMMTFDSGKLYGPRGVGALYISNRTDLSPVILGGGQERGLRAGTENVALAVGFAVAFEIVARERESERRRLQKMRSELTRDLTARIPELIINTDLKHSLPHVLNISVPGDLPAGRHGKSGEYLALALDARGFSVATKSACREGEGSVSHVIEALGGPEWRAANTLRVSLGRATNSADIKGLLAVFPGLV